MLSFGSVTKEEKIHKGITVHSTTMYTESIYIDNEREVLTEFLKLIDLKKAGEIVTFGLKVCVDSTGKTNRIEKTWTT